MSRGPLLGARIYDFRGFERSKFSWPVRRKTEMTVPDLQGWSDRSENHINRKSTKFLIDMDTQFFSKSKKNLDWFVKKSWVFWKFWKFSKNIEKIKIFIRDSLMKILIFRCFWQFSKIFKNNPFFSNQSKQNIVWSWKKNWVYRSEILCSFHFCYF